MTTALITGITGMVGSHLADYLLEHTDWDIYGMYRWRSSLDNIHHLLDRVNKKDRLYLIHGDLCDSNSLLRCISEVFPRYVFHLASQSYPKTSFVSAVNTLDTNILGTMRLLEAIRMNGDSGTIVHVCASSEVYGRVSKDKIPITEDCSFHPASPYAISKVGTDLIGKFYADAYGMKTVITRMFTHTGPRRGDVFAESSFAKQIAMIEQNLQEPTIHVGNLDSMRTWLDVRDAVRAYYMLVTENPIAGESYNIGGNFSCTIGDMLKHLVRLSYSKSIHVKVEWDRQRPLDADLQIPDISKFQTYTGWLPVIPFEKTMEDLLDYWRKRVVSDGVFLSR